LAGLPGRKGLVWVSGGFPMFIGYGDPESQVNIAKLAPNIDQEVLTDYVEDASRALNNASVAVYPVDARGLLGLPMADASKNVKIVNGKVPSSMTHVNTSHTDTMQYVAELTGGKAFFNTNDIQGAIRKVIEDSAVTYTLGFYTSEENWDDRYHKIKVKVKRSGAEVRAKKGYFAERPRT
jgi:VWFA-related protein